ncbi:MAG: hypothetical protein HY922_15600 [Elusimicrobia bacterium]|nr:hypothetical protein [Elusimicrobiota bacterium]
MAIVVSSTEANAIRNVVTVCELGEDPEKKYRGLPTVVFASADETGLGKDLMAIASPYTVPKNCFLAGSREGVFPPALFEDLETCVKRIFGWAPWPD